MLFNKKISLLIPCRNEETVLALLLRKIPSHVDEVIVVNNKSTDNTAQVAEALGARVIKERRSINGVGYGFAHQTGLKNATGDYIVAMDGDDTYPTESIKAIVTMMEKRKLDFVVCNRLPLSNHKTITPVRRLGIAILNLMIFLLYGYHFRDILTGMWVVKKEAVSKLNVKSGDWNFSPEIKLSALTNKNINFGEYHIPYFMRKGNDSKQDIWRTGFSHALFVSRYRFKHFLMPALFINFAKNIISIFI